MKLLKISAIAVVFAQTDFEEIDDNDDSPGEIVDADQCWLLPENATEDEKLAAGCIDDGFRNFFNRARFVMADYLCNGRDPAAWCGSALDNRKEFNKLLNYGCNCYPSNKKPRNASNVFRQPGFNGLPLDDLDSACNTMAQRYRCAQAELNCEYSTSYQYTWKTNGARDRVVCNIGSVCQKKLCQMDKHFAIELKEILGGQSPTEFTRGTGNRRAWEKEGKCLSLGQENPNLQCCGPFGKRTPYNGDTQKCCDGDIFMINDADATC